jgi:putative transposase
MARGSPIRATRGQPTDRRLQTAQRRVSRRQQGSNRRRKAVKLLAKSPQTVQRQRQDCHHTWALDLVRQYDPIPHEDLRVANLVKDHRLAKSISDAGWAQFLATLTCTAACAGKRVMAVHPADTSQACSGCGALVWKGLAVRWHSCPDCRTSLHRDHNSAKNVEWAGQALRGADAVGLREEPSIPRL